MLETPVLDNQDTFCASNEAAKTIFITLESSEKEFSISKSQFKKLES
jgi:hypothetical protein